MSAAERHFAEQPQENRQADLAAREFLSGGDPQLHTEIEKPDRALED